MVNNIRQNIKGFTLIELLVVISIIGILSTFAMVSLNSARAKARDALRKGEMAQLRTALNMYYDDNLQYPVCDAAEDTAGWNPSDADYGIDPAIAAQCYNDLEPKLSTGANPLIDRLPHDPKNPTNSTSIAAPHFYRYISNNDGEEYVLIYFLEDNPTLPQYIKGN